MKLILTLTEAANIIRQHLQLNHDVEISIQEKNSVSVNAANLEKYMADYTDSFGFITSHLKIAAIKSLRTYFLNTHQINLGLAESKYYVENWRETINKMKNGTWSPR